ncbi:hypothetical protein [Trinickia fusca]|uniref:hypothetical protein n=1 Tax=Trinickia fusca TaxID=2419777 RepID=UPI0015FED052|nr:hypothetical protein [Trinickia fusca]
MANITITKPGVLARMQAAMPGWLWFVVLWCVGTGSAMLLGSVFKVFMNATLFAVSR